MSAPETEVIGVNVRGVAGHEWDVTGVDTSNDIVTVDISDFRQDITSVLSVGDSVVVEERLSSPEALTVSSVSDNGDGTADVTVQESLSDSTVGGYLAYRLQIPGETDAELSKNFNLADAQDKGAGLWGDDLYGYREWDLGLDILHTESSGEHQMPFSDTVKLEVDVGGDTYKAKSLNDLSLTFSADTEERSGFEKGKWRYVLVTGLGMEISISGAYFDPEADDGAFYNKVKQEAQAGNTITFTLKFASLEFSGKIRPSDWTLTAPADNSRATIDFTFTESGEITYTGSIESGLDLLISAFFERDRVHTLMETTDDDGNRRSGATRYSGEAVIEELAFEASSDGDTPLTHSYSFLGDGPLDEKTQS